MEFVQPIRDKNIIEKVKKVLLKHSKRDYLLFVAGINTGLRISDLLKLRVVDVKNRTHIEVKEKKTGKARRSYITPCLKEYFSEYIKLMADDQYLFASRKGVNQPISRVQAWQIINDAAKAVGIKDRISCHSMRKSFGYHHYQQHKDIAVLQSIFNHSNQKITLRYMGLDDDIIDNSLKDFSL